MKMKMIAAFILILLPSCSIPIYKYRAGPEILRITTTDTPKIHLAFSDIPGNRYDTYRDATTSVLKKRKLFPVYVDNSTESDIHIVIRGATFHALPQEYLTGLSLGIIPSWGTRFDKYQYEIEYLGQRYTISVDETTINHIVLAPISLVMLLFYREIDIYKNGLSQYLNITTNK